MKKTSKELLTLICVSMVLLTAAQASCDYEQGWDLVDWGWDVDWGGSTQYTTAWEHAVDEWNGLGQVSIAEDTIFTYEDVTVHDYDNSDDPAAGYVSYNDAELGFNEHFMDTYSLNEKKYVALHELGHVLGLGHSFSGNVMNNVQGTQTTLGNQDEDTYDCLWP